MLIPCPQVTCAGTIEGGFCNICGIADSGIRPTRNVVSVRLNSMTSTLSTKTAAKPKTANFEVQLVEPVVPPEKRFCNRCSERVVDEAGLCASCGKPYSFTPTLKPGEVVADQFEVIGPLAYGGLGWIYLARDLALSRPVVLKGLLDSQDTSSAAVAVAERQFLASVKHPNIVSVYSFVNRGTEGFIVMEYIAGRTLKDIRKEKGPLPPAEALLYIMGILGAFAYLHGQDPPLIYCDFKPENCMVDGDEAKLIDLGGVRRANDLQGDIYGTVGFAAPEASDEPTPSSDLYSVARTLAVLVLEFKGLQGTYKTSLPPAADHPLLEKYDSLYRFLLKATHLDPKRRFSDAEQMGDQLAGIYQEVLAVEQGELRQRESQVFSPDPLLYHGPEIDVDDLLFQPKDQRALPVPKLDPADPAARTLISYSAIPDLPRRLAAMRVACHKYPNSLHAPLHVLLTMLEQEEASADIETYLPAIEHHWQGEWIKGCRSLKRADWADAEKAFQRVYEEFPGEIATKFAVAICKELGLAYKDAIRIYNRIIQTDPGFPSAIFGLARCQIQEGQLSAAVQTLAKITPTSLLFQRAQMARIQCLLHDNHTNFDKVIEAGHLAQGLRLEEIEGRKLTLDIQVLAFNLCCSGIVPPNPPNRVLLLNSPLGEHQLRLDIEANLRELARLARDPRQRMEYVRAANSVRPFTLF